MLEKINEHYSFTAPATLYDEEALTTLQLCARTASKVNECVQAYNEMEENLKKDLKTQLNLINDIDVLVQEFLGAYGAIENSGAYKTLTEIVEKLVSENKFAEIYDRYADYVKDLINVQATRIDTLLADATPINDSEVIDLRIDCEGNEWGSAGTAIRNMTRTLLDRLNDFSKAKTTTVAPVYTHTGKIMEIEYFPDGVTFTGTVKSGYGHSKLYNVKEGDKYYVSAYYGFRVPDVIFGDDEANPDGIANMPNPIGFGHLNAGSMSKNKFNKVVVVPEGATKMLVQWADNSADVSLIDARKIEGYFVEFEDLTKFIDTALTPLDSLHPKYGTPVEDSANSGDGYVLKLNENNAISLTLISDGSTAYKVRTYGVKAGQRVKFSCCANFGNLFYYMWKAGTNEVHSYEQSATGSTRQYIDKAFIVPIGVDRISVAHIDETPVVEIMTGVSGASPFSGRKIAVLGDSVSEFNDKAVKNYIDYLTDATGATFLNLANSGAGFLNEKSNNSHYLGQLITAGSTVPNMVLVMGSGNDLKYVTNNLGTINDTSTETLYGQMNQVLNFIRTRYSGKVKVGFVAPVAWKNYTPNIEGNVMEQYVEAMRKFCRAYCVPFLDLYHEGGLNPADMVHLSRFFDKEGIHPNADGHAIITSPIYKFLLGIIGTEGE